MTDPTEHPQVPNRSAEDYPALILCGGRSRRMGRDKANLPLGSQTVLQRVQKSFSELSTNLVLVIGNDAVEPKPDHLDAGFGKMIRDQHLDFGPLEGLRVGLSEVKSSGFDLAFVGTCDAPMVEPAVYRQLLHVMITSDEFDIAMPLVDGRHYPLTAIYRTRLLPAIEAMVEQKQLRVRDLIATSVVYEMDDQEMVKLDPQLNTIRNINTQEEYDELLKRIR